MKHLKVGQYVELIDDIKLAFDQGHQGNWSARLALNIGIQLRIRYINKLKSVTNPQGVLRETYNCVDDQEHEYNGLPIECLKVLTKPIPEGWFPISMIPLKIRNYNFFISITENGVLCFIIYNTVTEKWEKFGTPNGVISFSDEDLYAWTTFSDWPKEFDLFNEKTEGKQ